MKVIIAGGRHFNNYDLLKRKCDHILQNQKNVTIINGACKGADHLATIYAQKKGLNLIKCPADWDRYGKRAGFVRNTKMATMGTALIAFWDGKSKGTKMMIEIARRNQLKVRVILI